MLNDLLFVKLIDDRKKTLQEKETIYLLNPFYQNKSKKYFCIPESFNTNISRQLFDYTITYMTTQIQK